MYPAGCVPFCFNVKMTAGPDLSLEALRKLYNKRSGEEYISETCREYNAAKQAYEEHTSLTLYELSCYWAQQVFLDLNKEPDRRTPVKTVVDRFGKIFETSEVEFGFVGRSGGWLTPLKAGDYSLTWKTVDDYEDWVREMSEDEPEILDRVSRLLRNVWSLTRGNKPSEAVQWEAAKIVFEEWTEPPAEKDCQFEQAAK